MGRFEDRIVNFVGGVEYSVGVVLAGEDYAVEVSLGSASCDVAPIVPGRNLSQVGEEDSDGAFELSGVHTVVAGDE